MTLEFHPAVQRDFNQALDHYEPEGGSQQERTASKQM